MTNPTPLSPAAQAVDRAMADRIQLLGEIAPSRQVGAAALRAVADQVKLEAPLGDTDADAGVFAAHDAIYTQLLAIAAELEGVNA